MVNNELVTLDSKVVQEVEEVSKKQFELSNEEKKEISCEVQGLVDEIFEIDLGSAQNRLKLIEKIDSIGDDTIKQSTNACSLLKISMKDLSKLNTQDNSQNVVINTIADLNEEIKRLDPSRIDFNEKGLFGRVARSIRKYFEQFETADVVIKNIIESLNKGRKRLENDNKTLEIKQVDLRNTTLELVKWIEYSMYLNETLNTTLELAKQNGTDEELIEFIESQILFVVLQKIEDFEKQLVVNQNGYIALEIVKRNNAELIRNVKRASTTTVAALETAVIVASALYSQKIVLKSVNAVNQATDNMIRSTSELLRTQGVEIQNQSINSGPSVEALQEAFNNTFEAMNEISRLRREAIPVMKERVNQFMEMAIKGEEEISKIEATKK